MTKRAKGLFTIDNFWDNVKIGGPDECWPAIKYLNNEGYFVVKFKEKQWKVPSLVYFLNHGPWDPQYRIWHWCDDITCCNDNHLFVGTPENLRKRNIQNLYDKLKKDPITGCLNFTGPLKQDGYGAICFDGKPKLIHRLIWEIEVGEIPKGLIIRHFICDNPPCCFVDHLRLGTLKDNMHDAISKGRMRYNKKLIAEQVLEIKEKRKNGVSATELAKEYNVCGATIYDILANNTWRHLLS